MVKNICLLLAPLLLFGGCDLNAPDEEEVKEILMSQNWQYDTHSIWMEVDQMDLGENKRNSLDETLDRMEGGFLRFEADSVLYIQPKELEPLTGRWYLVNHGKALVIQPSIQNMPPQMIREISPDRLILEVDNHNGYFFPKIFVPQQPEE